VTYKYAYDGQDIIRETRSRDGQADEVVTYVHGPGVDEPLARIDGSGAPTYYHADGLGSIIKTTDATGAMVSDRVYDAWGNIELGAAEPGYAFTGIAWDPETGLYYYRARYYDPKVGRFISEDPIGFTGGGNFYSYVQGAPPELTDPLGLESRCGNTSVYCDQQVLEKIGQAYAKAGFATRASHLSSAGSQTEAGFTVNCAGEAGYSTGEVKLGDSKGELRLEFDAPRGVPFTSLHTHMGDSPGIGMPSDPQHNVRGRRNDGDTLRAKESQKDIYVISFEGLAVAPGDGSDPSFIITGNSFAQWFNALRKRCAQQGS
jgi:RHS repeat-associated protein